MRSLLTLEEFNEWRTALHLQGTAKDFGLGVECPKCKTELIYYAGPKEVTLLTSFPPQLNTSCPCGWHGYRTA